MCCLAACPTGALVRGWSYWGWGSLRGRGLGRGRVKGPLHLGPWRQTLPVTWVVQPQLVVVANGVAKAAVEAVAVWLVVAVAVAVAVAVVVVVMVTVVGLTHRAPRPHHPPLPVALVLMPAVLRPLPKQATWRRRVWVRP